MGTCSECGLTFTEHMRDLPPHIFAGTPTLDEVLAATETREPVSV